MIPLLLPRDPARPLRLVCLGAHSDDIEIGAGATVLRLLREHPAVAVTWVVFSASPVRAKEARASAARFLRRAKEKEIILHQFRDGFFPYQGAEIKDAFEALKACGEPDLILSHYRHDLHQDHRTLSELTRNTWRNHLILEYEIPKYDGDLAQPNCFLPVSKQDAESKAKILMEAFPSQAGKHWFDRETFFALLRLRGLECNSPTRYAEAFHAHKLTLGI